MQRVALFFGQILSMIVKICGIKTLSAARSAIEAGADMLGYNFYRPSSRYISPEACRAIQAQLGDHRQAVETVGVFVNLSNQEIESIMQDCGLDYAQLSGDEPTEQAEQLRCRWFKAIRPRRPSAAQRAAARYAVIRTDPSSFGRVSAGPDLLVDAYRRGRYGGTGQVADWSLAASLARQYQLLLAGGLNPENVTGAIRQVRPWGVDVASGVESAPGIKDPVKIKQFILAARQAAST